MFSQHRWSLAARIVPRLRLVFLVICVILSAEFIVGTNQLRILDTSGDQLTDTSVPVFVRAAETERALKNVILILQRIETAKQVADVDPLKVNLGESLTILRKNIDAFSGTGQSTEVAKQLNVALKEVEGFAQNYLVAKRKILASEESLDARRIEIERLRDTVLSIVERLSDQIVYSLKTYPLSHISEMEIELDRIEQHFYKNLVLSNALAEIALETEAIFDASVNLRNLPDAAGLERAEAAMRFTLRGIVVLIGQMPDAASQTEMANAVVETRDFLFYTSGLIKEIADLQARQVVLAEHKSALFDTVEIISSLSNDLTLVTRAQIDTAKADLAIAIDHSFMISTWAKLLSGLAVFWAVLFVVERQINRRMANLTNAVLAIADGQTSYVVGVDGPDELGKMARALEVFKVTARELRRSNAELEKFAYVAAHDLRSPLRAIQDLTEWTLEDSDNVFSDEGRENMALLQQRIKRLNQLLSDLLEYARAGMAEDHLATVSLGNMVGEIAELLDPADRFRISVTGEVETVNTYATPLRQILLNLISNGIKHHDKSAGQIDVRVEFSNGMLTCCVHDDGAGIPTKYHDRIFNLFQTLQPRDEVEGSGLGLAIIRKLLEHHNGSIAVHSDPEQMRGTTFIFQLPAELEATKLRKQAA